MFTAIVIAVARKYSDHRHIATIVPSLIGFLALVVATLSYVADNDREAARTATPTTASTTPTQPNSGRDDAPNAERTVVSPKPNPTTKQAYPGYIRLPPDSPYRSQDLVVEDVCRVLGQKVGTYAWLPGQKSSRDIAGRRVTGDQAAYKWSCTKGSPKLRWEDFTRGCQDTYPGTVAGTTDPHDAYKWICVPPTTT